MCGKRIGQFLQNDAYFDQKVPCGSRVMSIFTDWPRTGGRTHTVIIVHTCGALTHAIQVESIDGYILEQSVSVMAVT